MNMELIAARKASGKTQKQVAKETGTSETQYQNYEYGKSKPDVQRAILISKSLNKDIGDMETLFGAAPPTDQG